jgi:hypothetical protein
MGSVSVEALAPVRMTPVTMNDLVFSAHPIAAIGYASTYLIFGGGLFGAGVIFIIAKGFGK